MSRCLAIGLTLCAAVLCGRVGMAQQQEKKAKQEPQAPQQPKAKSPKAKPPAKGQASQDKRGKAKAGGTTTKPGKATAVTVEEAEALAKAIDAAAAKGDFAPYAAAVDDGEIFNRAVKGLTLRPDVRQGLSDGSKIAQSLATALQQQAAQGGSFRLLHVTQGSDGGEPRAMFRALSAQGLNYQELVIFRDRDGAVRVGDLFVLVTGELMSQTLRNSFLPVIAQGGGIKLSQDQLAMTQATGQITQMRQLLGAGKHKEAMAVYEKLPDGVKGMKTLALIHVMICAGLGQEVYAEALEAYRKKFPDSSEVELLAIDAMFLKKDYDGVLAAVDRLDKRIGGDPYLNLFRANCAAAKGDLETAGEFFRKLLESDPTQKPAYFALIELALKAEDFDEVARLLKAAEEKAGVQWSNLEKQAPFAAFVKSEQFAKWKEERGK